MKQGVTVILLSWKRIDNIKQIINSFRKQTIKPTIFLWNNNPEVTFTTKKVDWIVNSNQDMYSFAQWMMIPMVETEYLITMNDDLMPKTNDFIAHVLELVEQHPTGIVGPFGKRIVPGTSPYNGAEVRTGHADIVKGRCMCMRTEVLKNVPLFTDGRVRNDDIYISYYTANGKKDAHYISWALRQLTQDLPELDCGMDKDKDHMLSRNRYILELIDKGGKLQ